MQSVLRSWHNLIYDKFYKEKPIDCCYGTGREYKVIESKAGDSRLGIIIGGIVVIIGLGIACFLAYTGHETTASVIAGGELATVAGIFIYGTRSNRKEGEQKMREESLQED